MVEVCVRLQTSYGLCLPVQAAWSFVVTVIILFVLNRIPGLHIRQSEEEESNGGDFAEMGEVSTLCGTFVTLKATKVRCQAGVFCAW